MNNHRPARDEIQGLCIHCRLRYIWKAPPLLRDAICPECSHKLHRTKCSSYANCKRARPAIAQPADTKKGTKSNPVAPGPNPVGRPPLHGTRRGVYLLPADYELLEKLGHGKISHGIRTACDTIRNQKGTPKP